MIGRRNTSLLTTRKRRLPSLSLPTAQGAEGAVAAGKELAGFPYPDSDVGEVSHPAAERIALRADVDLATLSRYRAEDLAACQAVALAAREKRNPKESRLNALLERKASARKLLEIAQQAVADDPYDQPRCHEGRLNLKGLAELITLLLIGIGEAAVNFLVLTLWGASAQATWGLTISLGLTQTLASHFAGGAFSELLRDSRRRRFFLTLLVALLVSLLGTIVGLAVLRNVVLQEDIRIIGIELNSTYAMVTFAFLQLLFNSLAFFIGASRHSSLVSAMKMARSHHAWVSLRTSLVRWACTRARSRDGKAVTYLIGRFEEYAAWGRWIIARAREELEGLYDGFARSAELERAAAHSEQRRPLIKEPAWVSDWRSEAESAVASLPRCVESSGLSPAQTEVESQNGHRQEATHIATRAGYL